MKLLFLGDVVGRSGRTAIAERLPRLRREWALDFVVVNGENATGGMGLSGAHAALLLRGGGRLRDARRPCLRPARHDGLHRGGAADPAAAELRAGGAGRGARFFDAPGGRRVFVAQVLGQAFMKRPFDDPFSAIDAALKPATLGGLGAGGDRRRACRGDLGEDGARRTGATGGRAWSSAPTPTCRRPTPRSWRGGTAYPDRRRACAATTTA